MTRPRHNPGRVPAVPDPGTERFTTKREAALADRYIRIASEVARELAVGAGAVRPVRAWDNPSLAPLARYVARFVRGVVAYYFVVSSVSEVSMKMSFVARTRIPRSAPRADFNGAKLPRRGARQTGLAGLTVELDPGTDAAWGHNRRLYEGGVRAAERFCEAYARWLETDREAAASAVTGALGKTDAGREVGAALARHRLHADKAYTLLAVALTNGTPTVGLNWLTMGEWEKSANALQEALSALGMRGLARLARAAGTPYDVYARGPKPVRALAGPAPRAGRSA